MALGLGKVSRTGPFPMQKDEIGHTPTSASATFARATPRSTAGPGAGGRLPCCARWYQPRAFWTGGGGRNLLCTRRSPGLTTASRALTAKAPGQRDLLPGRTVAVGPRRLQHAGQPVEARLGEEDGAAAAAELALADVGVTVAVRAQRRL